MANIDLVYEFLYTSIGQAIGTYAPNEFAASLTNPIIQEPDRSPSAVSSFHTPNYRFLAYWIYWLDPFTYLVGGLLAQLLWDVDIECKPNELTDIPIPSGNRCGEYMASLLSENAGYVVDPRSRTSCEYCPYETGVDYPKTLNINGRYYAWRDVGITTLFCISSNSIVILMMKSRTKTTKTTPD